MSSTLLDELDRPEILVTDTGDVIQRRNGIVHGLSVYASGGISQFRHGISIGFIGQRPDYVRHTLYRLLYAEIK